MCIDTRTSDPDTVIPFYPEEDRDVTPLAANKVFVASRIPANPIQPNYDFTEYGVANELTLTNSRA